MGYVDKLETLFYGIITSLSFSCEENPSLSVSCTDKSFLMMTDNLPKTWEKVKHSEIVSEIGKKYGLTMKVDDTPNKLTSETKKESQTDYSFISTLAQANNFDFFVIGKNLYFQKPLSSTSPMLNLMWGLTLRSFSVDVNISKQISSYTVRSMELNKTVLWEAKAQASDITKLGSGSKTGGNLVSAIGNYFNKYEIKKIDSVEEGKAKAKAAINDAAMNLISGSGESIGIPEIRAGRYIKLEGLGKKLSTTYYMSSVTHTVDGSGYSTSFKVKGNAI
jgi:phage protein D